MHEISLAALLFISSVLISSISQILLKRSALKVHHSRVGEYLNPLVISGYLILLTASIMSFLAYRALPVSWGPVLESAGFVFVAILGYFFLKEKLSVRQIFGLFLIIIGIIITTIKF